MRLRNQIRNKITGFIFGKYDINKEAEEYLIQDEEFISGIEIIHYDEILYLLTGIFMAITIILTYFYSLYFIVLTIFSLYFIFLATELELIYLTNERVVIEKRGWFEKLFSVTNIQSIQIDQIAVISYGRAPFQVPTLLSGLLLVVLNILGITFPFFATFSVILGITPFIIPFAVYLIYFGLRLDKRSIQMYIIGVNQPIVIGEKKGVEEWFLDDIQTQVFERIHHTMHLVSYQDDVDIKEYPLEYSGSVKKLIKFTSNPLQKAILTILDKENKSKKEIHSLMNNYDPDAIDVATRELRKDGFVFYDRSKNEWCLNKAFVHNLDKQNKLEQMTN